MSLSQPNQLETTGQHQHKYNKNYVQTTATSETKDASISAMPTGNNSQLSTSVQKLIVRQQQHREQRMLISQLSQLATPYHHWPWYNISEIQQATISKTRDVNISPWPIGKNSPLSFSVQQPIFRLLQYRRQGVSILQTNQLVATQAFDLRYSISYLRRQPHRKLGMQKSQSGQLSTTLHPQFRYINPYSDNNSIGNEGLRYFSQANWRQLDRLYLCTSAKLFSWQ